MKNGKRIHKVVIKRMVDECPDTSYLGEYSNKPTSEFSIDRAHSLDCASVEHNHRETVDRLERAIAYLDVERRAEGNKPESTLWESLDEAIDILIQAQDDAMECDCGERGDMERNEYRYFNPSFNYVDSAGHALYGPWENGNGDWILVSTGDAGQRHASNVIYHSEADALKAANDEVRRYVRQDYERMESAMRGDWCYLVIGAEATYSTGGNYAPLQTVTSGFVGGIESDAGESYFEETEREQLAELRAQLLAIGFSKRAVSIAFKNVEREDN